MSVTGKAFYLCPLAPVTINGTDEVDFVPTLANVVDRPQSGNRGRWLIAAQDSDTAPTTAVVTVCDRIGATTPHNPLVHAGIAGVAGSGFLGVTRAEAVQALRLVGHDALADRMHDQNVGD